MKLDYSLPAPKPDSLTECHNLIDTLWGVAGGFSKEIDKKNESLEHAEEKLKTNSQNSSKPPSTDSFSTQKKNKRRYPKPRNKSKLKQGAQPGHKGAGRKLLPTEEVDHVVVCLPPSQCGCGGKIHAEANKKKRHQVHELPKIKPEITEYQRIFGRCSSCDDHHFGALPIGVPTGVLGLRAIATVANLTGEYHLSKRSTLGVLSSHFGLNISLGTISNAEETVSNAVKKPVEEVLKYVQDSPVKNSDETGHKQKGKKMWMWVGVAVMVAVFLIRSTRCTASCKDLLGETLYGILISDRYSSYTWVDDSQRQLCWAHLLRDFAKISERSGNSGVIGDKLIIHSKRMFRLWWRYRDGNLSREKLRNFMIKIQQEIIIELEAGTTCGHKKTEGTCKQILKHKVALWTFLLHEGVEPTNNDAERVIRSYVMWRKTSFGSQSERGDRYIERMMTVSTCCKMQGKNQLEYMIDALSAYHSSQMPPSLIPSSEELSQSDVAA